MKIFEPGKKSFTLFVIVVSVILLAGIPAVPAYTAYLDSSTVAYPGDTVTIKINGLSAGDDVTVNLSSTDLATSGGTITFTNFVMPFGFDAGKATTNLITTGNTGKTKLSVTKADDTVLTAESATGSPNTINSVQDITAQTFKTISIWGDPAIGSTTIGIVYNITGTSVTTAGDYTLSFALTGVNTGHLRIRIPDATTPLDKTISIVVRPPPPTPTQQSSEGGGGGPSSPSSPAAVVAPVVAPVVVAPVVAVASLTTSTVTTGAGGTITGSPSVNVGSGTVSFSPGTTVTTGAGNPVTSLGMGSFNFATFATTTHSFTYPQYSFENGHVVRTQHTFTYNVYTVV